MREFHHNATAFVAYRTLLRNRDVLSSYSANSIAQNQAFTGGATRAYNDMVRLIANANQAQILTFYHISIQVFPQQGTPEYSVQFSEIIERIRQRSPLLRRFFWDIKWDANTVTFNRPNYSRVLAPSDWSLFFFHRAFFPLSTNSSKYYFNSQRTFLRTQQFDWNLQTKNCLPCNFSFRFFVLGCVNWTKKLFVGNPKRDQKCI